MNGGATMAQVYKNSLSFFYLTFVNKEFWLEMQNRRYKQW
jgi:hypothetical protein